MTNPVDAVTSPDPYPYYAGLVAERPLAFDEELGSWVAAGAAEVAAVLRAPGLRVRPPAQPVPPGIRGTPAGEVFGSLVRMNDGETHTRLKSAVGAALARADAGSVRGLADAAARQTFGAAGPDLDELMFAVPARVVAGLCGLPEKEADDAARLVGDFVKCLRPDADSARLREADAAAERLLAMLKPGTRTGDDLLAALVSASAHAALPSLDQVAGNAVGLLSQTYEATAGLIGNTLLAAARQEGSPGALTPFVLEVARHDAPVQNTRRFAAEAVRCGGAVIEPGQSVLVVLAAANRDPAANPEPHRFAPERTEAAVFTFGEAAHRCPGRDLAVAITAGTVGALLDTGFDPASTLPPRPAYRPSPNARIPVLTTG
ncbi:cytochrome P450 [Actinocorallia libanotica]|uniref:Cytochrome P450 n=1 Tax=Actinocorallia libanotica TaxID=46162 RepID=A0ABN1RJ27_9ACTN